MVNKGKNKNLNFLYDFTQYKNITEQRKVRNLSAIMYYKNTNNPRKKRGFILVYLRKYFLDLKIK